MSPLTLMTWNVRYFGHGLNGLRATEPWMRRVAEALATRDQLPDVLALQEVETRSLRGGLHEQHQLDRFLGHLHEALAFHRRDRTYRGLYWPAHRYAVGRTPLYTQGLAMLVADDLEVEDLGTEDITHVRLRAFGRFKQRRIAAHVRVNRPGEGALDVFNTHLSLPAFLEVGPHRVPHRMGYGSNQLAEAERLIEVLDRAGDHAVVVGDFNSLPGSPVYDRLHDHGWVDGFARTTGRTLEQLLEWGTAEFLHLRMHIDHVFGSPRVAWHGFADHHIDGGPFRGLSDHAPKVGTLTLA